MRRTRAIEPLGPRHGGLHLGSRAGRTPRPSAYERFDHWLTSSRPPWKAGLLVAVAGVVAAALAVVLLPELMASWLYPSGWASDARTAWIDSLRTGLLGVIAFGSIAAWVIQYRQAVVARTSDEYTECVRNLSKSTWEQAAAIRDLETLVKANPDLQDKTLELLTVFVRSSAPRTEALDDVTTSRPNKGGAAGKPRPEPGVQEALRVIGGDLAKGREAPPPVAEDDAQGQRSAAGSTHREGTPSKRSPPRADGRAYTSLADITIDGAVLRGARLQGLTLRRSLLRDVKLEGADLSHAKMRQAVLSDADLEGAVLVGTSLVDAKLMRADLRDADLRGADLHGADLRGAKLAGAHLAGVRNLSAQLDDTVGAPHCLPAELTCSARAQLQEVDPLPALPAVRRRGFPARRFSR